MHRSVRSRSATGRRPGSRSARARCGLPTGCAGELSRVEPQFGQLETISVTTPPYGTPFGSVVVLDGEVWAAYGDSTLARIRPPRCASPGRRSPARARPGSPQAPARSGSRTPAARRSSASTRARSRKGPIRTISVGRRPTGDRLRRGRVWVANLEDDTRDPHRSGHVFRRYTIPVGDEPVAVAVGAGGVWVANAAGTVSRIDPREARSCRRSRPAVRLPGSLSAGGFVWVTVAGAADRSLEADGRQIERPVSRSRPARDERGLVGIVDRDDRSRVACELTSRSP